MSAAGNHVDAPVAEPAPTGGVWALPLLALGLGLIACCLVIPASDDNRRLMFERERLRAELDGLQRQVALNDEFLGRVTHDTELAGRLASRQARVEEPGVEVLAPAPLGGGVGNFAMSPFALVAAEPTRGPTAPVAPAGGRLAQFTRQPRSRLIVLGIGLFCCMIGLLGGGGRASDRPATDAD